MNEERAFSRPSTLHLLRFPQVDVFNSHLLEITESERRNGELRARARRAWEERKMDASRKTHRVFPEPFPLMLSQRASPARIPSSRDHLGFVAVPTDKPHKEETASVRRDSLLSLSPRHPSTSKNRSFRLRSPDIPHTVLQPSPRHPPTVVSRCSSSCSSSRGCCCWRGGVGS